MERRWKVSYNENLISDKIDGGLQDERYLRDHFAGLAMQAQLTRSRYCENGRSYSDYNELARDSYKIADAMLKARKEVKP